MIYQQKHIFITFFSGLGEAGSYFIEKLLSGGDLESSRWMEVTANLLLAC